MCNKCRQSQSVYISLLLINTTMIYVHRKGVSNTWCTFREKTEKW